MSIIKGIWKIIEIVIYTNLEIEVTKLRTNFVYTIHYLSGFEVYQTFTIMLSCNESISWK